MELSHLLQTISSSNFIPYNVNFSFVNLQNILLEIVNAAGLQAQKVQALEERLEKLTLQEERSTEELSKVKDELLLRPTFEEIRKEDQTLRDAHQKFVERLDTSMTFMNTDVKMIQHRGKINKPIYIDSVDEVQSSLESGLAGLRNAHESLEYECQEFMGDVRPLVDKVALKVLLR